MSTIITRNSANPGNTPSSLTQGELAINVTDGRLFYGSGSGNVVKEFTGSGSGGTTTPGGPNQSIQFNKNGAFSGSSDFTFNSASNALTLTGSFNVTGSTLQIGNNTLLGNTTLSGSIIISGSTTTPSTPTIKIYGDMETDGVIKFMPVSKNIDTSISASYIYVSGSTNDLYFSQNGAGYNNVTRLRWLEGNLYTGLLHGGLISSASSTTFNISSGSGIVVNLNASINDDPYPTIQYVNWPNLTNQSLTYRTSSIQTFIGIDSSGSIIQQTFPWVNGEYDTSISIGTVLHQNLSTINGSITYPNVAYGYKQRTYDFIKAFGPLKLSGYPINTSGSRGVTVGSGSAFADGRNYQTDPNNPSYIVDPGTAVSKIFRYYQSGSSFVQDTNGGLGYTVIDPTQYNPGNGGVLAPVAGGQYTVQRVFWYPNSTTKAVVVYYGNTTYNSISNALANYTNEVFNETENTKQNAVYLGAIIIKSNGSFTTSADFRIVTSGLFRSAAGTGATGVTNLASLSDVTLTTPTYGDLLMYDSTFWYNTKQLTGSYGLTGSISINNGSSLKLDTSISQLLDDTGIDSVDWQNRLLLDTTSNSSIDWSGRNLLNSVGNQSIDWENKILYDNTTNAITDYSGNNGLNVTNYRPTLEPLTAVVQEDFTQTAVGLYGIATNIAGNVIEVDLNIDLAVTASDLTFLDTDGIWKRTNQTTDTSTKLLGICVEPYNKGTILMEGTITVTTSSGYTDIPLVSGTSFYGMPVYFTGSAATFTTDKPTSGYVRVAGHMHYNSTTNPDYWIMKFNPSNDWYQI